jgi:hypothetical protein
MLCRCGNRAQKKTGSKASLSRLPEKAPDRMPCPAMTRLISLVLLVAMLLSAGCIVVNIEKSTEKTADASTNSVAKHQ